MENTSAIVKHKALADDTIRAIVEQDRITLDSVKGLDPHKQKKLSRFFNHQLDKLKGVERDAFIEKIQDIVNADDLWEDSHIKIINAITEFLRAFNRVPTKSEIARLTNLSRSTIHRHLKKFHDHDSYLLESKSINAVRNRVVSRFASAALKGDIKAAKLYFDISKAADNVVIKKQNNYIQINNTIIDQRIIEQLKPEQLQQIEQIIAASLEPKQALVETNMRKSDTLSSPKSI